MIIHLGCASPRISSNLPGDPVGHRCGRSHLPPYLVLLRVGFTLPLLLPAARCALTTPFHPYHPTANRCLRRYIFCGTFRRLAPPRSYLAPCPMEPGLSSLPCGTAIIRPTPRRKDSLHTGLPQPISLEITYCQAPPDLIGFISFPEKTGELRRSATVSVPTSCF
jgi:hypothetical protein